MNGEYIPKLAAAGCVDMVVSSPPEGHGMDVAMMDLPDSIAGSYLPGILVVGPGNTLSGDDVVGALERLPGQTHVAAYKRRIAGQ